MPNLLFDTAWWIPTDFETLFSLVPPGQIVFASATRPTATLDLGRVPDALGAAARALGRPDPLDRRPGSRCGSRPASRSSRPGRRSANANRPPTCCSTASPTSCCSARSATMRGGRRRPRCSRSPGWPATSRTRSTTRPCSRRSAGCSTTTRSTRPSTRTTRRRIAFLILAATVARTPDVPIPALGASSGSAPRSAAARSA